MMEIQVTFQDGPIEAKITAEEDEDYAEALERLADFVDGYEFQGTVPNSEETESATEGKGEDSKDVDAVTDPDSSQSNSIFDRVDATESQIHRIFKTGTVENIPDSKEFKDVLYRPAGLHQNLIFEEREQLDDTQGDNFRRNQIHPTGADVC